MVEELSLEVHDTPFIAEFIDFVIMKILPDWTLVPDNAMISPNGIFLVIDSDVNCSEFPCKSVVTSEMPSNLVVDCMNLSPGNHTYSAVSSTQSDHDRNSSHSTVAYMLLEDTKMATNPDYTSYDHPCSSSTDYNVDSYGYGTSSSINPDSPFAKPSHNRAGQNLISCYSSMSLSENDPNQELKLELDAVESEYQLMFQELTRMKVKSIEAVKRRWMTKKAKREQ